jgi:tRNA-Thr(GGU) m(6)t(6)A37 methyltransferase TsaA
MDPAMEEVTIKPIGYFRSPFKNFLEAPRQPNHLVSDSYIEMLPHQQFETALQDLEGFSRIWVIFAFHLKKDWRPLVMPPRGSQQKRGVFATRSPLRPNHLGLSCLELVKIEKLKVFVTGSDLLDGTPIFDVKPYLPYIDSYPEAKTGWLEGIENDRWTVTFSLEAQKQIQWLELKGLPLTAIISNQLEFDPLNAEKKRVRPTSDENEWIFSYRTWRIDFRVEPSAQTLDCLHIRSGYSSEEINATDDPYKDKDLHRQFRQHFPRCR